MVSDADHIKASAETIKRGLIRKLDEIDRERLVITEMIRVISEAPSVVSGASGQPARSKDKEKPAGARYNLDLSKQVDAYLDGYPWDTAVNIKEMIAVLKRDYGVQGKDNSLYAYIHKLLRDRADLPGSKIRHEKGVGYFKSRGEDKESTLVASV